MPQHSAHHEEVREAVSALIVALYRMHVDEDHTVISMRVSDSLRKLDNALGNQIVRWALLRAPHMKIGPEVGGGGAREQ